MMYVDKYLTITIGLKPRELSDRDVTYEHCWTTAVNGPDDTTQANMPLDESLWYFFNT